MHVARASCRQIFRTTVYFAVLYSTVQCSIIPGTVKYTVPRRQGKSTVGSSTLCCLCWRSNYVLWGVFYCPTVHPCACAQCSALVLYCTTSLIVTEWHSVNAACWDVQASRYSCVSRKPGWRTICKGNAGTRREYYPFLAWYQLTFDSTFQCEFQCELIRIWWSWHDHIVHVCDASMKPRWGVINNKAAMRKHVRTDRKRKILMKFKKSH